MVEVQIVTGGFLFKFGDLACILQAQKDSAIYLSCIIRPKQRGNVSITNLQMLNAILYVAEQGCKWRALPAHYGNWHTIYTRMNRWAKAGVLDRVFGRMQQLQIVRIKIETVSLDSTSVKVHPDAAGALKKTARSPSASHAADEPPKFIWLPRMLERL